MASGGRSNARIIGWTCNILQAARGAGTLFAVGKAESIIKRVPENIVPGTGLPARSLENVATRKWYHQQLADTPNKIGSRLSFKEQVLQAVKMRNEIKMQSRALISDLETF